MKTHITTISRMLLNHAHGPIPECRLLIAVICTAAIDAATPQTPRKSNPSCTNNVTIRHRAIQFLRGRGLDIFARTLGIRPAFILEMLEDGGYLERPPKYPFYDPVAAQKRREADAERKRKQRKVYYKTAKRKAAA